MKKRFNVTGNCHPGEHYMADTSSKFARIFEMVEMGEYFTMNRPRQFGKTTTLFALFFALQKREDYFVFLTSFEGIGDSPFDSPKEFCSMFLRKLLSESKASGYTDLIEILENASKTTFAFEELSLVITELVNKSGKKLVLLIDEVDKSSNNQIFVSFIGTLRDKYLRRQLPSDRTFHSVVLVGVHDVKNLKLKLRPDDEKKYNSPWNIAVDFEVDMSFQPHEIRPMLEEYARDRGVEMDAQAVAEHIFYYTSGYPFLVSRLCKTIDEKILPEKTERTWTNADVDNAALQFIRSASVNIDDLIKNLRNNPELYDLTEKLLIEGADFTFNRNSDGINLGLTYGVFANQHGKLEIHNRLYREIIYDYMSSNAEHKSPIAGRDSTLGFLLPGDRFNMRKAMLRFQELLKAEYSKKDRDFLERHGRLVFLAFISPIINGNGSTFKEPQISEERRLDVVISFNQYRYVVELKIWRGEEAHQRGLDQLAAYLDALSLDEGALLIFDHSSVKRWEHEEILHKGKRVLIVWA